MVVAGQSDLETLVRVHNARIVAAIAQRLRAQREPPLLGVFLIALADAMRGNSDGAMRIAGALGKQRHRIGYAEDTLLLELELARRALAELMTDLHVPAHERLRHVTNACALEATAQFRAIEATR
jgi:hypothetical protein